jgi:hypothetical protein
LNNNCLGAGYKSKNKDKGKERFFHHN